MLLSPRTRRIGSASRLHSPPFSLHTVVSCSKLFRRYWICLYPTLIRSNSSGLGGADPADEACAWPRIVETPITAENARRREIPSCFIINDVPMLPPFGKDEGESILKAQAEPARSAAGNHTTFIVRFGRKFFVFRSKD